MPCWPTPTTLPSLPRAVALLMTELAHEEPSLRRVAQLIGTDPALAARLLELANSRLLFRCTAQIAGIPEALALLGVVQLRSVWWPVLRHWAPLRDRCRASTCSSSGATACTAKTRPVTGGPCAPQPDGSVYGGVVARAGRAAHPPGGARSAFCRSTPWWRRWTCAAARSSSASGLLAMGNVSAGALASAGNCPCGGGCPAATSSAPLENNVYEPLAGVIHLARGACAPARRALVKREMAVSFPGEVGLMLGLDIDMVLSKTRSTGPHGPRPLITWSEKLSAGWRPHGQLAR
jgi:hypothetical protein